ncbi:MAG: secondary thiamine-phosphate synthase enzyme YjbQ [Synechococcales bacterium]|nr:secondary thiamine-phosphate synthase enzyme YjbQ [Synechococcales bacterium]
MTIAYQLLELSTGEGITFHNITSQIQACVTANQVQQGHVLVFSRHTTTALVINEDEERLLEDIKTFLRKLAPESDRYLHNDLHLRPNLPADEPMNAHSHLMAMMLTTSEMIPIVDGKLALGTYQSVLLLDLDGPRQRQVFCQVWGETGN